MTATDTTTDRKPFGIDHVLDACPNRLTPDLDVFTWGWRLNHLDLTSTHDYRWPFPGKWAESTGPWTTDTECPTQEGDGICIARTIIGSVSGGMRFGRSIGLLVAYTAADVLHTGNDKVRVKRAWVADQFDPVKVLTGSGADLRGADLRDAYLRGAYLRGAYLRGADLGGADLRGAYLRGAYLGGAYLRGARYSQLTLFPAGFDVAASGAVKL